MTRPLLIRAAAVRGEGVPGSWNPEHPVSTHIAVAGGRILAVGGPEIAALLPAGAEQLDLPGATVLPGFDDAHCHPVYEGMSRRGADLSPQRARTLEELRATLAAAAAATRDGEWVTGRGHLAALLAERRHPTRDDLDRALDGRPGFIDSADGHTRIASSAALRAAGLGFATPDPAGGTIERDDAGEPTGVLHETAMRLVADAMPEPRLDTREEALAAALHTYMRRGVLRLTAAVGRGFAADLIAMRRLEESGRLRQRITAMLGLNQMEDARALGLSPGFGDRVRIGPVKVFVDGSLPGRTAATELSREPFVPHWRTPPDEVAALIARAAAAGLDLAFHAVGELAIGAIADGAALSLPPPARDRRRGSPALTAPVPVFIRIEHCTLVPQGLAIRLRSLGGCAVMQPALLGDGAGPARTWLSEAGLAALMPFRRLRDTARMRIALSSDSPFTPDADPWRWIAGAVRHPDPGQALTLEEAVAAASSGGARAARLPFPEGTLHGSESVAQTGAPAPRALGARADLVAWPLDPLHSGPEALIGAEPVAALAGGERVI